MQVVLHGYCGDHPPADEEGFLAFARSLASPAIYERLLNMEPVSPVSSGKNRDNQGAPAVNNRAYLLSRRGAL